MKKFLGLLVSLLVTAACVFAADPVEGYWVSVDDKTGEVTAGWKIWQEGGQLYGTILSAANQKKDEVAFGAKGKKTPDDFPQKGELSQMKVVGTYWIYGLKNKGEGKWRSGNIVDPSNGTKYGCEITFHGADGKKYKTDTPEMKGKVGPIGRSQYWRKSTEAEASSLSID